MKQPQTTKSFLLSLDARQRLQQQWHICQVRLMAAAPHSRYQAAFALTSKVVDEFVVPCCTVAIDCEHGYLDKACELVHVIYLALRARAHVFRRVLPNVAQHLCRYKAGVDKSVLCASSAFFTSSLLATRSKHVLF